MRGGTSRHVLDVVRSTPGWEHHVATPALDQAAPSSGAVVDRDSIDAAVSAGAVWHPLDMRRSAVHPANLAAAVALRRMIHRIGPRVVHGHSSVGGAVARLATAAGTVPVAYTLNGLADRRSALLLERLLGSLTDAVIAVSVSEADLVASHGLVGPDRIRVIPNGIDLDPPGGGPDLRERFGLSSDVPLVGTVARLVPQKAPEELVGLYAAIAALRPDAHFVLIGMGPMQPEVDAAVAGTGIGPRFHQIPHLPVAGAVLGQLDVFVLPSRFEGAPYTPLEAMRAGTPVVLSDVVGNRDAVLDGRTGFLHPFGDRAGGASLVADLLDDGDLRERIAAAASQRLRSEFAVDVMGRRLAALYDELAAGTRRSTLRLPHPARRSSTQPPDASAAT